MELPQIIIMIGAAELLKEVGVALAQADKCLKSLEKLLREAREAGGASPELFDRISKANTHCDGTMQRYIVKYRVYNKLPCW